MDLALPGSSLRHLPPTPWWGVPQWAAKGLSNSFCLKVNSFQTEVKTGPGGHQGTHLQPACDARRCRGGVKASEHRWGPAWDLQKPQLSRAWSPRTPSTQPKWVTDGAQKGIMLAPLLLPMSQIGLETLSLLPHPITCHCRGLSRGAKHASGDVQGRLVLERKTSGGLGRGWLKSPGCVPIRKDPVPGEG